MKYRVVTVKNVKPHIVADRYPVLVEEFGLENGIVELETTAELTRLIKAVKMPVIVYGHSCYGPTGACLLEIYDEYRE